MKIKDIYSLEPISVTSDFDLAMAGMHDLVMCQGNRRVPKLETFCDTAPPLVNTINSKLDPKRFKIYMYLDEGSDAWGARLYSVVFDGEPFMLVKSAGRNYADVQAFLTNDRLLYQLIDYAYSLIDRNQAESKIHIFSTEENIENLEQVSSYNLFDYYDNHFTTTKYKAGDIVWAWVPENLSKTNKMQDYHGYVLTKVRIDAVKKVSNMNTYHITQCERRWSLTPNGTQAMRLIKFDPKSNALPMVINEEMIIGLTSKMKEPFFAIKNFVDKNGFIQPDYIMEIHDALAATRKEQNNDDELSDFFLNLN